MSAAIGSRHWTIPGGHVALRSSGPEPAMTSRDELRLLNTGDRDSKVEIMIIFSGRDPLGPYSVGVAARRVRSVRVNDLIDPLPVPLDTDYSIVIEATKPIVVQFTRVDTGSKRAAMMGTVAFPD
jgi:hypothetical protein